MTIQDLRARALELTDLQRSIVLSNLIGRIEGSEDSPEWQADPKAHVLGLLDRALAWEERPAVLSSPA